MPRASGSLSSRPQLGESSGNGEVLSVLCDKTTPDAGDVGSCAVTYEGPRCQYWFIGSRGDEDVAEADKEIDDGGAYHDDGVAICDWPLPEFPD